MTMRVLSACQTSFHGRAASRRRTGARPTPGCEIYLSGAGWVDFDPTNSIVGNRNLIRVALAWSPVRVQALWGTYVGSVSSCLGIQIAASVTEEPGQTSTFR
jgi:hypothetical protein